MMTKLARARPLPKVTAAVIHRDGKILVARRRKDIRFGGLWEFPGGKLEESEEPETGLERELAEEFGVQTRVERFLCGVTFRSRSLSIELLVFRVAHVSGDFRPIDHDEIGWFEPAEMDASMFTEPDRPVVRLLQAGPAGAGEESAALSGQNTRETTISVKKGGPGDKEARGHRRPR
jgi:8-oxo-dGTP diphosphatase